MIPENYDDQKKMLGYVGELYRKSKMAIELNMHGNSVSEAGGAYDGERDVVRTVELALQNCSPDTRCIIMNDYLRIPEPNWYIQYYSRSTYYRLKKAAVREFLRCLDI